MRVCAVHQPTFFPWLGYLHKIWLSDAFIFMDDAQFTFKSWTNRVKLEIAGEPRLVSCPVPRKSKYQVIKDVRIHDEHWKRQLVQTLQANYAKAPHFAEGLSLVEELLDCSEESLNLFNQRVIRRFCDYLGIAAHFITESELGQFGKANQRLIGLTKAAGCDTYLSGRGADGYISPGSFEEAGVELRFQQFTQVPYRDKFIPYLSSLDYIMWNGPKHPFENHRREEELEAPGSYFQNLEFSGKPALVSDEPPQRTE